MLKQRIKSLMHAVYSRVPRTEKNGLLQHLAGGIVQQNQRILRLMYQDLLRRGGPMPSFQDVEFRIHSQNGEDGILHYLFSVIGTTNKRVLEVCVQSGIECNAANLILNEGWDGLLFDGSLVNIEAGRRYYSRCADTTSLPPRLEAAWITAETINEVVSKNGFSGEIDLFSLDIDGVDYWIWKALTVVNPRVVMLEFNTLWGPEDSVTIPYNSAFRAEFTPLGPNYAGASLAAFTKLAAEKGYRLVGVERLSINAFFVRNDVAPTLIPEVSVESCLSSLYARHAREFRLPTVRDREWVRV